MPTQYSRSPYLGLRFTLRDSPVLVTPHPSPPPHKGLREDLLLASRAVLGSRWRNAGADEFQNTTGKGRSPSYLPYCTRADLTQKARTCIYDLLLTPHIALATPHEDLIVRRGGENLLILQSADSTKARTRPYLVVPLMYRCTADAKRRGLMLAESDGYHTRNQHITSEGAQSPALIPPTLHIHLHTVPRIGPWYLQTPRLLPEIQIWPLYSSIAQGCTQASPPHQGPSPPLPHLLPCLFVSARTPVFCIPENLTPVDSGQWISIVIVVPYPVLGPPGRAASCPHAPNL
ncbi:hypothetical protein AB1N83_007625 [Pleurotus pulmonarius]